MVSADFSCTPVRFLPHSPLLPRSSPLFSLLLSFTTPSASKSRRGTSNCNFDESYESLLVSPARRRLKEEIINEKSKKKKMERNTNMVILKCESGRKTEEKGKRIKRVYARIGDRRPLVPRRLFLSRLIITYSRKQESCTMIDDGQ